MKSKKIAGTYFSRNDKISSSENEIEFWVKKPLETCTRKKMVVNYYVANLRTRSLHYI